MNVETILRGKGPEVVTIRPGDSLTAAAALLADRRIGAVVVSEDGRTVAGILSERDIVRAIARHGAAAMDRPTADFMTAKVVTCSREEQVDQLMARMTQGRFRHLPVLVDGQLAGIVSIGDVVKARIEDVEAEAEQLRNFIAHG